GDANCAESADVHAIERQATSAADRARSSPVRIFTEDLPKNLRDIVAVVATAGEEGIKTSLLSLRVELAQRPKVLTRPALQSGHFIDALVVEDLRDRLGRDIACHATAHQLLLNSSTRQPGTERLGARQLAGVVGVVDQACLYEAGERGIHVS